MVVWWKGDSFMGKKSLLTYMEKDGPDYSEFVFYADKRCLSDEKYRKDLDLHPGRNNYPYPYGCLL